MSNSRSVRTGPPPPSNRTNEYFVPKDGIDREVITADICRYLGNDALVRPGTYEVGSCQSFRWKDGEIVLIRLLYRTRILAQSKLAILLQHIEISPRYESLPQASLSDDAEMTFVRK